ncbi:MAG TPA: chaperone modulator CbpM, partial [Stellaceae bacterium]|nr:chaperone modulator CbpM [Stellaceae bacterium]
MTSVRVVCELIGGLEVTELERWIVERWVLPEEGDGGYVFHEIDVARVRLIVELRRDLAIDDEAMPVVLGLLDQVYALRRRMRGIA